MNTPINLIHAKTRSLHRDYSMLRDRMHGANLTALADKYRLTKKTVSRRMRKSFTELQVMVMNEVKADPDSPRKTRFSLDAFNSDPQACRMEILTETLERLENAYPALKSAGDCADGASVQSASGAN